MNAAYRRSSRKGSGPTLIHARPTRKGQQERQIAVLAIAGLLFAFGFIAQNVAEGTSFACDKKIVAGFRDSGNPSAPVGPAWVRGFSKFPCGRAITPRDDGTLEHSDPDED
jgi:hypothetical protein